MIEEFGRDPVCTTEAAKRCSVKIVPPSVFDSSNRQCSLDERVFATLEEKRPSWPTPGPAAYRMAPLSWLSALQVDGDWDLLQRRWLTILMRPMTIAYHKIDKTPMFVLRVTREGFLYWRASLRQDPANGGFVEVILAPPQPDRRVLSSHVVTDAKDWKVAPVKASCHRLSGGSQQLIPSESCCWRWVPLRSF